MKYYKIHNQDNIAEERFNQIKNYCKDWTWEKNSVAIFGGGWNSTSFSGSHASHWSHAPLDPLGNLSARGVCDHMMLDQRLERRVNKQTEQY